MLRPKIILTIITSVVLSLTIVRQVAAFEELELQAEAAILIEATTGRVLFEKNAHQVMYPASMTKILTAMLALEHIHTFEPIFVGPEIQQLPPLSSRAGASLHEVIRGENLVRLLMIPSGNEIAMVIAQNVAQRVTGRRAIPYMEAEEIFAELMNERARELGATNSNFVNPHGFHHPDHFTTPADLALIASAALEIPILNQIMRETTFVGNGATQNRYLTWSTRYYNVSTHNQLLIETSDFFFPYATGMKTGFHDQAGYCIAASAERDGFVMISLVFNSGILSRFRDTIMLFEYGFESYDFRKVQAAGITIGEVQVEDVRLGDPGILEFHTNSDHTEYLSQAEVSRINYTVEFDRSLRHDNDRSLVDPFMPVSLAAPIYEGQILGKIVYTLDGNFLFSDNVIATFNIYGRDFSSDMRYYRDEFFGFMFSPAAIPIWVVLVIMIFATSKLYKHINDRRERNFYKLTKRYESQHDGKVRWYN